MINPTDEISGLNSEEYFQYLYTKYKKKVLNTALNMLQNHEDAEEIMQDVFVEVYFSLGKFRGESSVSTWIYRIVINKSLDLLKKKKRKKRFAWFTGIFDSESGNELHVVSDFIHPGILLENKDDMTLLYNCIDKLPEKQKTALVLSVSEQLSYNEISSVMGTSLSSVESLLFRARQNLKKELGNYFSKNSSSTQVNSPVVV
jgi:RNA polymerase sigma factor (sigma-70 family)